MCQMQEFTGRAAETVSSGTQKERRGHSLSPHAGPDCDVHMDPTLFLLASLRGKFLSSVSQSCTVNSYLLLFTEAFYFSPCKCTLDNTMISLSCLTSPVVVYDLYKKNEHEEIKPLMNRSNWQKKKNVVEFRNLRTFFFLSRFSYFLFTGKPYDCWMFY